MEMAFWCWVSALTVFVQSFVEMVSVELCAWDVEDYASMCHVFFVIFTHFFYFFSLNAMAGIYFPHVVEIMYLPHLPTCLYRVALKAEQEQPLFLFSSVWHLKLTNVLVLLHQLWSEVCTCGCCMSAQMLVLESSISPGSASRNVVQI